MLGYGLIRGSKFGLGVRLHTFNCMDDNMPIPAFLRRKPEQGKGGSTT